MQNPKKQKREERRAKIRQGWEERYGALVTGEATLAEILMYDDERLMKLAAKGLRLFQIGKLRPALKIFRGLVLLDPWVPYFHYLLGGAYEKLGSMERALREYQRVEELTSGVEPAPDIVPFTRLGRGRVLARLGRTAEAREALASIVEGSFSGLDPALLNAARLISAHLEAAGATGG